MTEAILCETRDRIARIELARLDKKNALTAGMYQAMADALRAAEANEMVSFITGRPPRAPVAGVKMAKYMMWFNPAHAVNMLGLPQTPPEQAFSDAIVWFKANGYVKR